MSVTIEGVFVENSKNFIDDPLKTSFKSPLLLREHKKNLKNFKFYPDTLASKCPLLLEGVIKN